MTPNAPAHRERPNGAFQVIPNRNGRRCGGAALILIQASSAAKCSGKVAVSNNSLPKEETWMNFYTRQHKHYCGIDLHAKAMYVCILDQVARNWSTKICRRLPKRFYASLLPIARMWSSASNVCSRGIGWRTSVRRKELLWSWGMRSI